MNRQHLIFKRGGEMFAIHMDEMIEVFQIGPVRRIPLAEPSLAGYTSVRDVLLPVFDPILFVTLHAPGSIAPASCGILAGAGRPRLIILSDEIGRVADLPATDEIPVTARVPAAIARMQNGADATITTLAIEQLAGSLALT